MQDQTCTHCGSYAPCTRSTCPVGAENLWLIKAEREQNLKVLLMLRVRFGVFQTPTHPTNPHDHQDAEDFTSRPGYSEDVRATYRQIYLPRSSMSHYLEVVVYAPMRPSRDPDYNALLAYQAFNGKDWSSHEVRLADVLEELRQFHDRQERYFLTDLDKITLESSWSDRDKF